MEFFASTLSLIRIKQFTYLVFFILRGIPSFLLQHTHQMHLSVTLVEFWKQPIDLVLNQFIFPQQIFCQWCILKTELGFTEMYYFGILPAKITSIKEPV